MEKLLSERKEYEATRNTKHLKKYFDRYEFEPMVVIT